MSQSLPWKRLLSEGAVIVASILLAFAIQAWWEGRQDIRLEADAIATLHAELDLIEGLLDNADRRDSIVGANAQILIGAMSDPSSVTADSLTAAIGLVTLTHHTDVALTAYDLLVNSGSLDALSNVEVRTEIVFLRSLLSTKDRQEAQHTAFVANRLGPFLDRHVDRGSGRRPLAWHEARGVPIAEARAFPVEWDALLSSREFSNLVHKRVQWLSDVVTFRDMIRTRIATIRRLTGVP